MVVKNEELPLVILQARVGSTRLPGKVLAEVNGKPIIYWQIRRILEAISPEKLVLATSENLADDKLIEIANDIGIKSIRGSADNVADRFHKAILAFPCISFIRLTGDCPLVMPKLILEMIEHFETIEIDYLSNSLKPSYPDGLDVEIIRTSSYLSLMNRDLSDKEMEHVTYGLYTRSKEFFIENYENKMDLSDLRWTLDYSEDLEFIRKIYDNFKGRECSFTMEEVLDFLKMNPGVRNKRGPEFRNVALKEREE